ncbi:hypothetical protein ACHAW6_010185 [Cyclotella cf. meneghiniana]
MTPKIPRILSTLLLLASASTTNAFPIRLPALARGTTIHPGISCSRPEKTLPPRPKHVRRPRQAVSALYASDIIPYYEALMERMPSKKVLDVVEKARGSPIVASDLATKAGISLSQARKDLTALASLSRGDIAVSTDGDLLYTFPENINAVLSSNSAKYRALSTWRDTIFPPLFYATKVGFGVVLVASLVAIFSTIFFVMTSSGSSGRDDDRRDRRGGGMPMFGGFWGPSPFDFFYYRPYYSRYYYSPAYDDMGYRKNRDPEEMGFLESVFSYVFGDGNPNGDVEERRLALVAEMIRSNGGAVTAEQLAPFCDDVPMPIVAERGSKLGEERAYVDESFVLPIVTQLDGVPQVTEEGDIVYTFPELMTSAATTKYSSSIDSKEMARLRRESRILRRAGLEEDAPSRSIKTFLNMNGIRTQGALERSDLIDILEKVLPEQENTYMDVDVDDPTLLLEREFKFSLASSFQTVLAGLLGVVNLGGALYLGNLLGQYALYGVRLPSFMGVVQQFFPFLLGYAVLFNAIPLFRNFWIQRQNEQIRQRNERRKSWKDLLGQKAGSIQRKLMAATRMGKRLKQLGSGERDIVFDTRKDFVEIEAVKQAEAMNEFDKLLERSDSRSWE